MTITVTTADAAENLDRAGGRVMRLLVDADATGQRLSVLSCEAPAGEAGPPLHVHPGTDELFLVQGGTLLLYADGATHRLDAGAAAFVPRGTAHTFASGPGEPVRFLTVHTPGGFEQMHRDVCRAEREAGGRSARRRSCRSRPGTTGPSRGRRCCPAVSSPRCRPAPRPTPPANRRPRRPRAGPADLDGPGGTGSNGKQN
jgi:mannose-6-phosphate isomerase-like protein (cupin superfamily)